MRPRIITCCLVLVTLLGSGHELPAADDAALPQLTIAIKEAPPFAFKGADGEWHGLSIHLLERLGPKAGFSYRLSESTSVAAMLDGVAAGEFDAAIAAITITEDREKRVDFSHSYHSTGLGIVTTGRSGVDWLSVLSALISPAFLSVIGSLSLVLLAIGTLVWLAERRANPDQFGGSTLKGLGSGFWWSAVTMTTVGYGDKAPATPIGRMVGLVWMFAGLIIIASFTAQITSSLTLSGLGPSIQGPEDLQGTTVAVVEGTTGEAYSLDRALNHRAYPDLGSAIDAVANGEATAVIHDHPILAFTTRRRSDARLVVLDQTFDRQDYGIALPSGSPWREPFNRAVIDIVTDRSWASLLAEYGLD